jgi:hypothetical protein
MGRADIAECGKRFSSDYQPAGRGRPKGSRNRSTILRAYLKASEPTEPEEMIQALLDVVFGKRKRKKRRRAGGARVKAENLRKPQILGKADVKIC